MLRRILGRAELTEREARTLLGLIKRIRWSMSRGAGGREGMKNVDCRVKSPAVEEK
jgi:tRNA C32,U32 (ribose-2'-O)-methylase TrmJ